MKKGLYIHIPFCVTKCKYCSFNSYAGKENLHTDYLLALKKEIRLKSDKSFELDTIYIGGGTPSILKGQDILSILETVRDNFVVDEDAEISMEANPNTITKEKAETWKKAGINRLSIGLQSSNDKILKLIGRSHTLKDYINAIRVLKEAGFDNINTDLMIALPGQKIRDVKRSIKLVAKQNCKHISCYSLILEEGTPLYELVENKKIKLPNEDYATKMYAKAVKTLKKYGFNRYEVSNFAKSGYECKHNVNCWNRHEYLGLGAGANGFVNGFRYGNVCNIDAYIKSVKNGKTKEEFREKISNKDAFEETLMLGLRMEKGVEIKTLNELIKKDFIKSKKKKLEELSSLELIEYNEERLKVTDKGFYVLNKIILDLI